jgi:hypothetical protein
MRQCSHDFGIEKHFKQDKKFHFGPGTREKVRAKRINIEGNTHAQEINVSQLPV